jgi:hypothetical protein
VRPVVFDTLLFFHVLAAFMLGATVVVSSALVLGAPAAPRTSTVANVLWAIATELGRRARDIAVANVATWHWLRTVAVVLLLADMVWKPGA